MPKEIKRRFLLKRFPTNTSPDFCPGCTGIEQHYFVYNEKGAARVRLEGSRCLLTVKSSGLMVREEDEWNIGEIQFKAFKSVALGSILKDRYFYKSRARDFCVDAFKGTLKGLYVLEVEFPSIEEAQEYDLPGWAVDALEVTHDSRYTNASLAVHGLPPDFER